MPANPFSDANLANAVKKLPDLPANQVHVGAVATKDDQGVEVEGEKDFANGTFVEGDASWWRKQGWKAAVWFGWKGGSK